MADVKPGQKKFGKVIEPVAAARPMTPDAAAKRGDTGMGPLKRSPSGTESRYVKLGGKAGRA